MLVVKSSLVGGYIFRISSLSGQISFGKYLICFELTFSLLGKCLLGLRFSILGKSPLAFSSFLHLLGKSPLAFTGFLQLLGKSPLAFYSQYQLHLVNSAQLGKSPFGSDRISCCFLDSMSADFSTSGVTSGSCNVCSVRKQSVSISRQG